MLQTSKLTKPEVEVRDGTTLTEQQFAEFVQDAVHVRESDCGVSSCSFKHSTLEGPHGDAIQLIPEVPGRENQQYALAYMQNVTIEGNIVNAPSTDLQGIFASDGLFYNLVIKNNVTNTRHHGITINGALKITLLNNIGKQKLYPARIGGGIADRQLWVIDFYEDYINYEPVNTDSNDVQDFRTEVFNDKDIFLRNFRYEDYRKAALDIPDADGRTMARQFYDLALQYGEIATMNDTKYATPIERQSKTKKYKSVQEAITFYMGVCEVQGAEDNPLIVEMWDATWYKADNDDEAWCAAAANKILMDCGLPRTNSPRALSFLNWGIPCNPSPGCIMVRDYGNGRGHVGFLMQETDTNYLIAGGNQNNCFNIARLPKSGIWHARKLKSPFLSRTAIGALLNTAGLGGVGLTGLPEQVINQVSTDSGTEKPAPEKVEVSEPTTETVGDPADFNVPAGYILIHEKTAETGLMYLGIYCVLAVLINVVIFWDRLKKIFNNGV